ncbi:MAG: O-antigen ligase family protein [Pseudomonadota bacterium]
MHRTFLYAFLIMGALCLWNNKFLHDLWNTNRLMIQSALVFFLYSAVSVFWNSEISSQNIIDAIKIPIFISLFVICFAYLIANRDDFLDKMAILYASLAVIVAASLLFVDVMQGSFALSDIGFRYRLEAESGRLGNSNFFAKLFMISVLLFLFQNKIFREKSLHTPGLHIFLALAAFSVFAFFLVSTGARGANLALIASLIITAMVSLNRGVIVASCLFVVCVGGFLYTQPEILQNILSRADSYRFGFWQEALQIILNKPVFGHGFEYPIKFINPHGLETASTHNIILGVMLYGGGIGLGLFLFLSILTLYYAYQLLSAQKIYLPFALLVAGAILHLTTGHTFLVNLNVEWLYSWFVLAIIMGLRVKQNKTEIDHAN